MQLSDFGLSVIVGAQNKSDIKLSGTMGYVAPEYLLDGMSISTFYLVKIAQHFFKSVSLKALINITFKLTM